MSLKKIKIVTFCFGNQSVKMTHFDLEKSHKAICGFKTFRHFQSNVPLF